LNKECYALFKKAIEKPKGLRFSKMRTLCECIGMRCERTKGSHFIFRRDDPFFLISIQKMKDGMAKPYQVRQLLYFIKDNNLDILE
jgi:predicted RNA binding protein YcfA (HicA-like mRNA interferase family)